MLAAQIELILLLTGLATAGALVLSLAPVAMMKTAVRTGALRCTQPPHRPPLGAAGLLGRRSAHLRRLPRGGPRPNADRRHRGKGGLRARRVLSPFRRRPAVLVMALADAGMAAVYLIYLSGL